MKSKKIILLITIFSLFQAVIFSSPKKIDSLTKADAKKLPEDRPSVALVLAGGGAKGFAHLPIMEYIDELDIPIDMIIGTSIGSIVGGFYAAGYSAKNIVEEFGNVDWSPMFADIAENPYEDVYGFHGINANPFYISMGTDFSLELGTGLSNGQNVYKLLRSLLIKYPSDMSFDDLYIPFRAVATDMLTGDAYVLGDGDLAEAMRASMSLPAVFEPAVLDDYYFMDGGLRYNLAINVAKKMGYDIIIAIDISQHVRDNPEIFSANPAVAILNTITIAQYTTTEALLKDADLVMTPDISNFGTLDFKKADIIYEQGKAAVGNYKEALENIRKRIYPKDYDKNGVRKSPYRTTSSQSIYQTYDNLIPTSINIEGAYDQDLKYINIKFAKKICNKPLTQDNFDDFMNDIYLTGNYVSIRPRIITEDGEQKINLLLTKKKPKEVKLLIGTDFEQVVTNTTALTMDLDLDLQFRGLTGIGSMLSLHGTFLTDIGGEFYYMQPFNPYLFVDSKVGYLRDRYPLFSSNFDFTNNSDYKQFDVFYSGVDLGFRTIGGNLFTMGGFYKFVNNSIINYIWDPYLLSLSEIYDFESETLKLFQQYFGVNATFSLFSQDSTVFTTEGISIDSDMRFGFPVTLNNQIGSPFLTERVTASFSIPFNKTFSFTMKGLFGTDFLGNLKNNPIILPEEGFSPYDRIFFPSISIKRVFGTNTAAATAYLQFKPSSHLTVFGGDLILRIEGTAGVVNYDWKDTFSQFTNSDTEYPIIWSGALGVGVKIKPTFNILMRLGVCSTYETKVAPLFCLDIGDFVF